MPGHGKAHHGPAAAALAALLSCGAALGQAALAGMPKTTADAATTAAEPPGAALSCSVDAMPPGQGRLCVQLAIRDGRPSLEPGGVFVANGLPAAITRAQVLDRLQVLLARVLPQCDPDDTRPQACLLHADAALRQCLGSAGAASPWAAFWLTVQETCGGSENLLTQVSGLFSRLGEDSPFLLGVLDDRFVGDLGELRLQVVALTADTPLRIVGPLPEVQRAPLLRAVLAPLQGGLWDSNAIKARLLAYYQPLQLAPEVIADRAQGRIRVVEAAQLRDVALPPMPDPADATRRRVRLQALYQLLDDHDFRRWLQAPTAGDSVAFVRDLGYTACREPFWLAGRSRRQSMALSTLGLNLQATRVPSRPDDDRCQDQAQVSARVLTIDEAQPEVPRKPRFVGVKLLHRPGQGLSVRGVYQQDMLALAQADVRGGIELGQQADAHNTGQIDLTADYIAFERLARRLSFTLGALQDATPQRYLAGALRDESRLGQQARLQFEPFRERDGQRLTLSSEWQRSTITTRDAAQGRTQLDLAAWTLGAQWQLDQAQRLLPWRAQLLPALTWGRVRAAGPAYRKASLGGSLHLALEGGRALDIAGRIEAVSQATPLVEQATLGGTDSVRGFRADDGIGARLWSLQTELWWPWPGGAGDSAGNGDGLAGWLAKLRLAPFVDLGAVQRPAAGAQAGARQGAGIGLRLLLDPAVIKLDYGWRHGPSDTHGPRGRLHFSLSGDIPI